MTFGKTIATAALALAVLVGGSASAMAGGYGHGGHHGGYGVHKKVICEWVKQRHHGGHYGHHYRRGHGHNYSWKQVCKVIYY